MIITSKEVNDMIVGFHSSFLYDKADWKLFKTSMDNEAKNLGPELNIENLSEILTTMILKAANKAIPKSKEILKRDANLPGEIVEVLKCRNYWGKKFRWLRDSETAKRYTELEQLANELIVEHRIAQWNEFLKSQGPHPLSSVPFWKRINRLRSNKRHKKIETLIVDGVNYETEKEKADLFAQALEDKFGADTNTRFNDGLKNNTESYISSGECENSYTEAEKRVKQIDAWELNKAFKNMNAKSSTDPCGLSNKLLKNTGTLVIDRILTLFNWCLIEGRIPQNWKCSVISMLLKNGQSPNELNSYRPISMTPCLARLFERVILERIQNHLKGNKIIVPYQSGFRKVR